MRYALMGLLCLVLTACAGAANPEKSTADEPAIPPPPLPDMGPAPAISGTNWLNTARPIVWEELRGQVVMVDMWTFGCINCQRVIPYLSQWHADYADQGLVIVGNHYPEFSYEADWGNLTAAIDRFGIAYPVVQDNDGRNWRAYNNRYWPTLYLIDKAGHMRYRHIGEGRYAETEAAIQALLAEIPTSN